VQKVLSLVFSWFLSRDSDSFLTIVLVIVIAVVMAAEQSCPSVNQKPEAPHQDVMIAGISA